MPKKTKKELAEREDFIFSESISDIALEPKTEDQITKALFNGEDPNKIIDAYEEQLGIKVYTPPQAKTRYKTVMLSPGTDADDEDRQLLEQLMNDPELYQVIEKNKYWTPKGELKIFVEYLENLDVRAERLKKNKDKEK